MKGSLLLSLILIHVFSGQAQVDTDFGKNASTKLQLPADFTATSAHLIFRWPSTQAAPLRFTIGSFAPFQAAVEVVETRPKNFDKTGTINSVFSKKKIAGARPRKGGKVETQRYQLDLPVVGYGNTIVAKAEAFRFFTATYSNSEINGTISTRSKLLSDTSYLAGVIHLPDSSLWTLDLKFQQTLQAQNISGELYTSGKKYILQQQLMDRNGKKLIQPGLLLYSDKVMVGAIDFPWIHGTTGIILFSPRLSLNDKQAFIAAGALFFGYRNSVKNGEPVTPEVKK